MAKFKVEPVRQPASVSNGTAVFEAPELTGFVVLCRSPLASFDYHVKAESEDDAIEQALDLIRRSCRVSRK